MPEIDYSKGVDEMQDIGFKMRLGYKRTFNYMRAGLIFLVLALPVTFIGGTVAEVLWLGLMLASLSCCFIGVMLARRTSKTFRREMAQLEKDYPV